MPRRVGVKFADARTSRLGSAIPARNPHHTKQPPRREASPGIGPHRALDAAEDAELLEGPLFQTRTAGRGGSASGFCAAPAAEGCAAYRAAWVWPPWDVVRSESRVGGRGLRARGSAGPR